MAGADDITGGGLPRGRIRLLRVLNCDEVQGFLYSRPLPRETFESNFLSPGGSPPAPGHCLSRVA
jgi:hypothetical protein